MTNTNSLIHSILKNTFGYDSFRENQESIINTVLSGRDALALMATGSGKSLCYQVPAIALEGVTIVISPLISLMSDQVMQLTEAGVEAVALNSNQTSEEYNKTALKIARGEAKIVYIAPEAISGNRFYSAFEDASIKVPLIAVDEAHCVSTWGQDFRPDYLAIPKLREKFPKAVLLALTATATAKVQDDIIKKLQLRNPEKFIASFNRKNLFFSVIAKKRDVISQIASFLDEHPKDSGIIYCTTRKEVDILHEKLFRLGFNITKYHAGLDKAERDKNQDDFVKDRVSVIVATVAFGMGINKSNVRFVIHKTLSKSIEQYYQEVGRAGRDGLPANAILMYASGDKQQLRFFIQDSPNRAKDEQLLNQMVSYAVTTSCRRAFILNYFGEEYRGESFDKCCCDNCRRGISQNKNDLTIPAQKFMSCVIRTGEFFGPAYIAQVLTGSLDKRIKANKHDRLSTFNIGGEFDKNAWVTLCDALVSKGYMGTNEHGGVFVTPLGRLALKNRSTILLQIDTTRLRDKKTVTIDTKDSIDKLKGMERAYFEKLKTWRFYEAKLLHKAPYMIMSDKTLLELAHRRPHTIEGLFDINGLGQYKVQKWGEALLLLLKEEGGVTSIE